MKPTNCMRPISLEFPQTQSAEIDKDARIAELEKARNDMEWATGAHRARLLNELVDKSARIADLERQLAEATHLCAMRDAVIHDLERQLADATTWRSPETAPRDGTVIVGKFPETLADIEYAAIDAVFYRVDDVTGWDTGGDLFADDELLGWFPLPETKKEEG